VDTAKICMRLESYAVTYYNELRSQILHYSNIQDVFPDNLKGPKRVVALICSDGILLSHWPNGEYSFVCAVTQQRLSEATREIPGGPFVVGSPLGKAFDLYIANLTLHEGPNTTGPVIWRAPWDKLELSSKFGASRWGIDHAKASAINDVLSFIAADLMQMRGAKRSDILNNLRTTIEEFKDLLTQNPPEEDIQVFLSNHPIILSPTAFKIFPKHRLGSEYVTDFVIHQADGEYILVEIEAASHMLFNKNGDPSALLSHAQRQVEDWREWVNENLAYARNSLPGIIEPDCWVIIGRDISFSNRDRKALRRKNKELSHITIMTFDDLFRKVQRHLENLDRLL
jgi:hypothetical protein